MIALSLGVRLECEYKVLGWMIVARPGWTGGATTSRRAGWFTLWEFSFPSAGGESGGEVGKGGGGGDVGGDADNGTVGGGCEAVEGGTSVAATAGDGLRRMVG